MPRQKSSPKEPERAATPRRRSWLGRWCRGLLGVWSQGWIGLDGDRRWSRDGAIIRDCGRALEYVVELELVVFAEGSRFFEKWGHLRLDLIGLRLQEQHLRVGGVDSRYCPRKFHRRNAVDF